MNSLSGQGVTLGDAAHYSRLRIDTAVAQIERRSPLVDPELLRMAYQVADCPFVRDETISTEPSLYGGRAEMLLKWFEASDGLKMWVAVNHQRELSAIGYDAMPFPSLAFSLTEYRSNTASHQGLNDEYRSRRTTH